MQRWHCPWDGIAYEKGETIQIWLRSAVRGGFGPALSEFDATGVPAPAASSVESCSHLANHQASASHNGITVSSAFLLPAPMPWRPEHAGSRSWSSQARLCAKNSISSTSPLRIGDFRDVPSVFTVIHDSCSCMNS
jgi:hypothetical protein